MSATPGPWKVYDQGKDDGPEYGCSIESTTDKMADWVAQEIYNRADARLIAAAPELYEACLRIVRETTGDLPPTLSAVQQCADALVKAGQSDEYGAEGK